MKTASALAAKELREELKKAFPNIKFKVISSRFSGGSSIDVSWVNGPTTKEVKKYSDKYECGSFDCSTYCYSCSNVRYDIHQVKYLFTTRNISNDILIAIKAQCESYYGDWTRLSSYEQERRVYEEINKLGSL